LYQEIDDKGSSAMLRRGIVAAVLLWNGFFWAQAFPAPQSAPRSLVPVDKPKFEAFEVASIKPVEADAKAGRYFKMDGPHRWAATNFTTEALIALAYDLNPRTISGGPE
jgi:hypothetical protein